MGKELVKKDGGVGRRGRPCQVCDKTRGSGTIKTNSVNGVQGQRRSREEGKRVYHGERACAAGRRSAGRGRAAKAEGRAKAGERVIPCRMTSHKPRIRVAIDLAIGFLSLSFTNT